MVLFLFSVPQSFSREEIRDVIAFWDSSETEEDEYTFSNVHEYLELVFNHYGLRLTYVDVNKPLPKWLFDLKIASKYKGVVSWFIDNNMKSSTKYMEFLSLAKEKGLKIMLMGEPGFMMKDKDHLKPKDELIAFWDRLGFAFNTDYYNNPLLLNHKINGDNTRVEFERGFDGELYGLWGLKAVAKGLEPWLSVTLSGQEEDVIHPVAVSDEIAVVQYGYEIFTNPQDFKVKWRVNPFLLVKKLFVQEPLPIPDVTTQCGKRASFIHIDGDGFVNVSLTDKKSLSGEVIIDKIIKKYGFPTSASVVTAEVSSKYLGNPSTEKKVQQLYSLPNVEPVSHTFRHPLSWEYEPNLREKKIYLSDESVFKHKGPIVAYLENLGPLNYKEEILDSVQFIDEKLLTDRKTGMVFWTGSCRPPEEALRMTQEKGLLNLNGGDGRFDSTYESYAGLSSLYRKINGLIQPYSAFANENIYTNLWAGPYSGFRSVIKSFENTEEPFRIKPINVYYHFYSGERTSSLNALEDIYDYLKGRDLFPMFASDYSRMVMDWDKVKITKSKVNDFTLEDYGHVRTFRFEQKDPTGKLLYPDYEKSSNVIGHKHHQDVLCVTLKKGKSAHLVLTIESPKKSFISSCNAFISEFTEKEIKGFGREPFNAKIVKNGIEKVISSKESTFELKGDWK
ncbi:unnamed protein product [Chrysoparadoxa australica]